MGPTDALGAVPRRVFLGRRLFEALHRLLDGTAATVLIAILATTAVGCGEDNVAPVASDGTVALDEDTTQTLVLEATDANGDRLTFEIVDGPEHGVLSGTAPELIYAPEADFYGEDALKFLANDGRLDSNVATVTLLVNGVNDAPTALADEVNVDEDVPVTFVLAADDPDGDALLFSIVDQPGHGVLDTLELPRVTYTPEPDYDGADAFTFRASDGVLESELGTVTLEVFPVDDAPVALPQTLTTPEDTPLDIVLEGTDAEAADLVVFVLTAPSHGTLSASALPTVTYTPDEDYTGSDSFTFGVSDGAGDSEPATIDIDVTAVNDAPEVSSEAVTTTEDNPLLFELPVTDVDSPVEALTTTLLGLPRNGRLHVSADQGAISAEDLPLQLSDFSLLYVPPVNFFSPGTPPIPEAFDILASDGESEAVGTVYLVVLEGGIIYVSTEGNDALDGRTPETAMRNLGAALRRTDVVGETEEPDLILLDDGRYCEAGLEITHSVRIAGTSMDEVTIDGSAVDGRCEEALTDGDHETLLGRCAERSRGSWPSSGVFRIGAGGAAVLEVEFSDLTIAKGTNQGPGGAIYNTERLTLQRVRLRDNCSLVSGGALANERPAEAPSESDLGAWGEVVLSGCEVLVNGSLRGGGLANAGVMGLKGTLVSENEAFVLGGGIHSVGDDRVPEVNVLSLLEGSAVRDNRALRHGGGLYVDGHDLAILDSSVIGNTAGLLGDDGEGGGIYAVGDPGQSLSVVGSFINQNVAPYYGGLYSDGYEVQIGQSQINDNQAEQNFGGGYIAGFESPETSVGIFGDTEIVGNDSDGGHAGLTLDTVDVSIIQALVRDNVSEGDGGGLTIVDSRVLFEDVRITENRAAVGGGVLVEGASLVELDAVDITDNTATEQGGGLAQTNGSTIVLDTTIFEGNFAWPADPESDNEVQQGGGIAATGGAVTVDGALITNNESADWGGGIYAEFSELVIENGAEITGNRAVSVGPDLYLFDGALPAGGGVYFTAGRLDVTDSTVSGNRAEVLGGGLVSTLSEVWLSGARFSENSAHAVPGSGADREIQRGGGIYLDSSNFVFVDTSITDNYTADHGGGGYIVAGEGGIVRSTLAGNSAAAGEDPAGDAVAEGGGLYVDSAVFSLVNSTLSGNWADWEGGALLGSDSDINLFYVTVYGNGSGTNGALSDSDSDWVFHAAAVAANTPGGDCDGIVPVSAFSLDSDDSCGLAEFDLVENDPMLDETLADNGGPTLTHAILEGSPLIDRVPEEECLFQLDAFLVPHTDQRSVGFSRPTDGDGDGVSACDVGAIELQ